MGFNSAFKGLKRLILALDGSEWAACFSSPFTSAGVALRTHRLGGRVDPRGLWTSSTDKYFAPTGNGTRSSVVQTAGSPVAISQLPLLKAIKLNVHLRTHHEGPEGK
jgi:hypothetical protein